MPTYQYRCQDCDAFLEVVQSFSDDALTVCPECEGSLRKVYNSVGVVFKGSGFYRTDSRDSKGSTTTASPAKTESSTTTESKPATTPAAPSPTTASTSTN